MANILNAYRSSPGSFNDYNDRPRDMTRYTGGKNRTNQPFIPGYFYPIISVPERLFNGFKSGSLEASASGSGIWDQTMKDLNSPQGNQTLDDSQNAADAERWLHSCLTGFSPHSRTLTTADDIGLGGQKATFITGQDITTTFSATFKEMQGLPISNIFRLWTSVFDPYTGLSPLLGNEFNPSNYKGDFWMIIA